MKLIDLHVHSTASDGSFTPEEVTALASEAGLTAIALTDHDTVSGVGEALEMCIRDRVIDGLLDGIVYGTHGNDHMLSVSCAVVVEQLVIGTDLSVHLIHVFLNDGRKSVVVRVAGLSCLEENIRVLGRTSLARMVRVQSMCAELIDGIQIKMCIRDSSISLTTYWASCSSSLVPSI